MALKDRLAQMPVVGTAMAVQRRTKRDAADQFGAALAFFGFISLIPLIAIAVSITATVLAGQPERIQSVVDAIEGAIPGLGASDALASSINNLVENGGTIGLVGGVILLFTGLRITQAAQTATRVVFGLPLVEAKTVMLRLWQLASLVLLGVLALGSVAVTSVATTLLSSGLGEQVAGVVPVLIYLLGGVFNILLFWAAYRIYSVGGILSWRDLMPGAILGGVGWSLLQYFGATYVASQADSFTRRQGEGEVASGTVAVLATLVGLLLLFYIAGRLYVYGAELIAELAGVNTDGLEAETPADDEADEVDPTVDARDEEPGPVEVAPTTDPGPARVPAGVAAGADDAASLAASFRARGRTGEDAGPGGDGEVVPWQAPSTSPLQDRRTRQVAAFASSALAVLTAGLLGRRS